MKKYNLSNIMKRAWELVKKAGLCISEGLNLVDWGFGAKLYYDCKKEDWFCKNPGGSLIKKILWTVADKLEVL